MENVATLRKYRAKSEKELHEIIEEELDALEEGLLLLKYEFGMVRGVPDFLCVDSGGRLVIIEVKLQEDENMLFQALRYYDEVHKSIYAIAKMFPDKDIDTDESPRIMLVAEGFSDTIRRMSTLVRPEVELYAHVILRTEGGKKGIHFHPIPLVKTEETPTKPRTVQYHIDYIKNEAIKSKCQEVIKVIQGIGKDVKTYTTQAYIGFRRRGRKIGSMYTHRMSFDIEVVILDEDKHILDYEYVRVDAEDKDTVGIMEKIRETYEKLG